MRWTLEKDQPKIAGLGYEVLLDGEPQRHVVAFDTDEGWVEALCLSGHECWEGHETPDGTWYTVPGSGEPHMDPDHYGEACRAPRRYGRVELVAPAKEAMP